MQYTIGFLICNNKYLCYRHQKPNRFFQKLQSRETSIPATQFPIKTCNFNQVIKIWFYANIFSNPAPYKELTMNVSDNKLRLLTVLLPWKLTASPLAISAGIKMQFVWF